MPYVFVTVIAMLGLIGAALIILLCSFRKPRANMSTNKPPEPVISQLDRESKVVVIMAGDNQPTFLAEPISRVSSLRQQAGAVPSSSSPS
ncbi:protein GLUTAMINE DUMPER 5-like [Aristolochia californica]|uniref:protein GLUTAMINE DUMPER 5-like n=1 Tax=Aristolochia californica TaxID=171875 RepID=UPI0035E131B4